MKKTAAAEYIIQMLCGGSSHIKCYNFPADVPA